MLNGLEWLVENEEYIRWVCRIAARSYKGRDYIIDDLWDVAVDKVQRLHETFDPLAGASLKTYIHRSLRWYMWKWIVKKEKHDQKHTPIDLERAYIEIDNLESKDEVYYLLSELTEQERELLVMHHVYEWTFGEMGDALGCSTSSARNYYYAALERSRERLLLGSTDRP